MGSRQCDGPRTACLVTGCSESVSEDGSTPPPSTSTIPCMTSEYLLRLAIAALVGATLGAEREFRDKAAGLRTVMLICIGSCLFTIFGAELASDTSDPTRITSAIVSGVGFLGAGVIFRRGRHSTGITTAATIWCAAALGMGIGGGVYALTLTAAAAVLVVLWLLPPVERIIDNQQEVKTYELKTDLSEISIEDVHKHFDSAGLKVLHCEHGKRDGLMTSEFEVVGRHDAHTTLTHALITASWTYSVDT